MSTTSYSLTASLALFCNSRNVCVTYFITATVMIGNLLTCGERGETRQMTHLVYHAGTDIMIRWSVVSPLLVLEPKLKEINFFSFFHHYNLNHMHKFHLLWITIASSIKKDFTLGPPKRSTRPFCVFKSKWVCGLSRRY